MSYSVVAHSLTQSPDSNGVTSGSLNTTGADLIVLGVVSYSGVSAPTISDSKGNTWTAGTAFNDGSVKRIQFYYCQAPVVGAGHTFSAAGSGDFDAIAVLALSGSASTPLDQQAGNPISGTPGSVTPTVDNEIVVTLITDGSAGAIDTVCSGGFTIPDASLPNISSQAFGIGLAYLIQTTAAAANPTWSSGGSQPGSAIITFKAAAGGGTAYSFTPAGGLVGGGTVAPATAYGLAPSGGLVAGGLAGIVAAYQDTPSGGLVAGGTAPATAAYADTPSGGLVGGGQADVATTGSTTYVPSGGLVAGGTSAVTTDYHETPAGGLVAGSGATFGQQTTYTPAGGLIGGGAAAWTLGYAPTPGGGLVGGGSAGFVWSATFGPAGGLVGGGAATVVYVSGSVPAPPATFLWVADAGARTWYSLPVARVWYAEGRAGDVGRVRNTIEEESGMDKVSLGMDFGDLAEVRAGHKITSCTVTVPAGVTYSGVAVEANGYRVDALFSSSTPGTYSIVFTATLDTTPASTVVRTGTLVID